MRLNENEAQALLEEYTGPRYEIERHTMVINLFFFFFLTLLKSICQSLLVDQIISRCMKRRVSD